MPLWNIYHTPDVFASQDTRNKLATDITKLSTDGGLPGFYVVILLIPLSKENVFVAAKTREETPFVRLVVQHMAPYIADQGYDWEITVSDTPREFWRFNGISPPPLRSEAESVWAKAGRPIVWAQEGEK
ncbi:Fc.00g045450.m01.CDS01 [Cosmosporella sp. VM-42]